MRRELREQQMVQAARRFYIDHLTAEEVAEELGVSRSTVSRLLKQARHQGIVKIRVRDPRHEPPGSYEG